VRVETSTEFNHDCLLVSVSGIGNEVLEFIDVIVKGSTFLEVSLGLKAVDGYCVRVRGRKFFFEFLSKVLPVKEPGGV